MELLPLRKYQYRHLIIPLLLIITLAAYWPLKDNDFVNFDDPSYIISNEQVLKGISAEGICWAFSSTEEANWHPLTWISHMLDVRFFGTNPRYHHFMNLFFHLSSTVLLYMALAEMTGAHWLSALVAALFAIHPLHVESVAWAAERKDVLSTFFWMLTLLAYGRYAKAPALLRFLPVTFFLALGLMSKPMLVTLPFVLLLLDFWPLQRLNFAGSSTGLLPTGRGGSSRFSPFTEKLPLLAMVAVSSVMTYIVQERGGSVGPLISYPVNVRLSNALISYMTYIWKTIWPFGLSIFYPYRGFNIPLWQSLGAGIVLLGTSIMVILKARHHPYLAVGWFWYTGTLVPVIGLVQVGEQSLADRYTYVPIIGLFLIVVWGVFQFAVHLPLLKKALAVSACLGLLALSALTWAQVGRWRSSEKLFRHAINVTSDNYLAHTNLGATLAKQGWIKESFPQYAAALEIRPDDIKANTGMGLTLVEMGRPEEALPYLSKALKIMPDFPDAHLDMGLAMARLGRPQEAISHYREALKLEPRMVTGYVNLGNVLSRLGRYQEAETEYNKALQIKPGNAAAHNNLGNTLAWQGRLEEAVTNYKKALRSDPKYARAHANIGAVLLRLGRREEAARHFTEALRLKPDMTEARAGLDQVSKKIKGHQVGQE